MSIWLFLYDILFYRGKRLRLRNWICKQFSWVSTGHISHRASCKRGIQTLLAFTVSFIYTNHKNSLNAFVCHNLKHSVSFSFTTLDFTVTWSHFYLFLHLIFFTPGSTSVKSQRVYWEVRETIRDTEKESLYGLCSCFSSPIPLFIQCLG